MPERHPTLEVLSLPAARRYVTSRFFSGFARSLVAAMLSYHVYERTGSYAALGLLGLAEFTPVIPLSLLGGASPTAGTGGACWSPSSPSSPWWSGCCRRLPNSAWTSRS